MGQIANRLLALLAMYTAVGTNYIRVPTTLIGLIDASVSNRVAVNWNGRKNRLGGYYFPLLMFLDFSFLKTLPIAEVRNGMSEILKIISCTDIETFDLLDKYCNLLIETKFGNAEGVEDPRLASLPDGTHTINKILK